jgi:hypothetical protein
LEEEEATDETQIITARHCRNQNTISHAEALRRREEPISEPLPFWIADFAPLRLGVRFFSGQEFVRRAKKLAVCSTDEDMGVFFPISVFIREINGSNVRNLRGPQRIVRL